MNNAEKILSLQNLYDSSTRDEILNTLNTAIAIGKDADIVIYDPTVDFTITNEKMHSDCDHTIWEGVTVHGYPVQTYCRGRLVYDNGEFVGERGYGKFVRCSLK